MKFAILALLGLLAMSASVNGAVIYLDAANSSVTDLGTALKVYFNAYQRIMPCGVPDLNIPILAPYTEEFQKFDYDAGFLRTKGNLSHLSVSGLNSFNFLDSTYNATTHLMTFDTIFKEIQILAEYKAETTLNLGGVPLTVPSAGVVNWKTVDFRVVGDYLLLPSSTNPKGLEITHLNIHFYLGNVIVNNWNNLWDIAVNNFVNHFSSEYTELAVQELQAQIGELCKELALPQINEVLKTLDMQQLTAFFTEQTMKFDMADCTLH